MVLIRGFRTFLQRYNTVSYIKMRSKIQRQQFSGQFAPAITQWSTLKPNPSMMENDVFKRSALAIRSTLLMTSLALAAGCASISPAPNGDHLSAMARDCTTQKADATTCLDALFEAAARQERRETGQLLLTIAAKAESADERDALISAGLWLEPEPWLPEGSNLLEGDLAPLATRTGEVESGEVLLFKGAKLRTRKKRKIKFSVGYAPTVLQPDALAAIVAAASGADAAVLERSGETVVVPAAARTVALTGYAPQFNKDQLDLARAFTGADRAFNDGRHLDATAAIGKIYESFGEEKKASSALCASAGVAVASADVIAALSHGDPGSWRDKVREACTDERGDLDPRATFLGALVALEVSLSNVTEFQTLWKPRIDAASGQWTARQSLLIQTLLERQIARDTLAGASCDEEASAKTNEKIAALDATLRAHSREDLALDGEAEAVLFPDGETLDSKGVRAWLKDQRLEDRQWLGIEALGVAVDQLSMTNTPLDRVTMITACDLYQRELEGLLLVARDGESPWTYSERMVAGVMRMRLCPSHVERTRSVVVAAIKGSSEHPDGSAAIAQLIAATTLTGIARMLSGETNTVLSIANAFVTELKRVRMSLGDSSDERTLAALLDALSGSAKQLNNPMAVNSQLTTSVDKLDAIIEENPSAEGKMTRAAPVIRFSLLAITSAHASAFGLRDQAVKALDRLEKTLEADLATLLVLFDQPTTIAPALVTHIKAATTLLRGTMLGQSVDIDKALDDATVKGLPAGWWRTSGHITASLLRLGAAIIYQQVGATDKVAAQRAALNKQLDAMAKDAIADFKLEGSGWELLTLMAPAQTAIGDAVLDGSDQAWDKIAAQALPTLEARAKDVLASAKALDTSDTPPDLVSLMLEVVRATLTVGIENIYKGGTITDDGRIAIAKELSTNADAFPPQMRIFLESIRAILLSKPDPEGSLAALDIAQSLASKGSRELEPLPLAVGLFLDRESQRSPGETLALISGLGLDETESKDCERRALARALLPYRAKLLSLERKRDGASALRRAFLRGVTSGEQMDARIQLVASAQRGHLAANLDISYPASRLLSTRRKLPEEEEQQGNFQIGLGYSSLTVYKQSLQCNVNALPQDRPDFVASIALELAVDSLLYAPIEVAQSDLQLATATLQSINVRAQGNNPLQDLSGFPWVTHLAGARGLLLQAKRFELITVGYPVNQLDGEMAGRFEASYPAIAPVIRAANALDSKALDKAWPKDAPKTLSKSMMLAAAYHRASKSEDARKLLTKSTPAPVQLDLVDETPETSGVQFKKVSDALRSVKLDGEACELGWKVLQANPALETQALVLNVWRTLDPELAPACHANLSASLLGKNNDPTARVDLRAALLALDYFPGKEPLMMEQARDLLELGKIEQAKPLLNEFSARVLRANPGAIVYLATMQLTAEIASGNAPDALVMVNLKELAAANPGVPPELMKWIDRMHEQREDSGAIISEAQQLLFSFLQ